MKYAISQLSQVRQEILVAVQEIGQGCVSEVGIPLNQPPVCLQFFVQQTQVDVPEAVDEYAVHVAADAGQVRFYDLEWCGVFLTEQTDRSGVDDGVRVSLVRTSQVAQDGAADAFEDKTSMVVNVAAVAHCNGFGFLVDGHEVRAP